MERREKELQKEIDDLKKGQTVASKDTLQYNKIMNKIEQAKAEFDAKMASLETDLYDQFNMRVGQRKAYMVEKIDDYLLADLRAYYDQKYEVEKGKHAEEFDKKLCEMDDYLLTSVDTFLDQHREEILQAADVGDFQKILELRAEALLLLGVHS